MANKIIKWKGKNINNVWLVLDKTTKKSKANSIIYKCKNLQDNKIYFKSSAYLMQFKKRNSKKTSRGKKQKWIKIPINVSYKQLMDIVNKYADKFNFKKY